MRVIQTVQELNEFLVSAEDDVFVNANEVRTSDEDGVETVVAFVVDGVVKDYLAWFWDADESERDRNDLAAFDRERRRAG